MKWLGIAAVLVVIVAATGYVGYRHFVSNRLTEEALFEAVETQVYGDSDTGSSPTEEGAAPAAASALPRGGGSPIGVKLGEVPDVFKVKFECSNGDFIAEFHKDWAPQGVARRL